MGQDQTHSKKLESQADEIDVMSQIFQKQPTDMKQRALQAVRISQICRLQDEKQHNNLESTNKDDQSEVLEDLCRLTKEKSIKKIESDQYILKGILLKQSPKSLFNQWTERYCFLTPNKFIYNETNSEGGPRAGTLNFNLLSCSVTAQQKHNRIQSFMIKIVGSDKQFIFSAANKNDNKKWSDALTSITEKSLGRQYNLTYLSHYNRFWRKDYFSQKQFREQAETGDLILMRGSTQSAAMQRAITQQQFDHVALVIKNIKGQVLLFEANGAVGVGVMPWHRFIGKEYYKQQEIVVYRKLNIERTKQFFEQIEEFVQRNMGRKYKFSVKKYIMNRQSSDVEDKKSYFCSSLVAKIYKNLGLLDQKLSSTQYMPHHFTQKQNLQLKQNGKYGHAFLGNEHIIVFEKRFLQDN